MGRCRVVPNMMPSQYFMVLFPLPQSNVAPPRVKREEQPFGDDPDESFSTAKTGDWEQRVMGIPPSMHCLTLAFPSIFSILVLPLLGASIIPLLSFVQGDYLIDSLEWATADMQWYIQRLENPAQFVWSWYWEVFKCLFCGITDAFKQVIWTWPNDFWYEPSAVFREIVAAFERGLNPGNFLARDFFRFRPTVFVWRFFSTFIFTCCRLTVLINHSDVLGDMEDCE